MLLKNECCQWSCYLLGTVKHEVSRLGGVGDTKAAQSSGECKQVPLLFREGTSACESWQEFVANGILKRLKEVADVGDRSRQVRPLTGKAMCRSSVCCMWLVRYKGSSDVGTMSVRYDEGTKENSVSNTA